MFSPVMTYGETYQELVTINEAKGLAVVNSPEMKKQENNNELARVIERDAWIAYEQAKAAWQNSRGADALKPAMDATKAAYDAAVYAREDGKTIINNLKKEIEYNTENLYLTILNMGNNIEILELSYELQNRAVKIEKLKVELGMGTQFSLEKEIKKVRDLQIQLQELYDNYKTLKWNLNRSMGRNPEAPLTLSPVTFIPIPYDSEKNTLGKALETSLAIEQFNRTVEDKLKEVEEKQYTASDKVEKLKLEIKKIDLTMSDTEYGYKITIKNIYDKLLRAQKSLVNCRTAHEIAENEFLTQELQYELGVISSLVFESHQMTSKKTQVDYEKAVYDYYLAAKEAKLAEEGIFITSQ
jgi:outer membrane protein TolC